MTTPPDSHYALLPGALPRWLGQASATRRHALKSAKPLLGKALALASAEHKAQFKRLSTDHWAAQNQVDDALKQVLDPKAFAKPLLEDLLIQRFGVNLDSEAVFIRLYIPQTVPWLPIRSGAARAWTVSLLDAALHNFDYKEAEANAYEPNSTFISRPTASGQFDTLPAIRAAMPIQGFIRACRELNIGALYAHYLRGALGLDTPAGNGLPLKVDASQRAALRAALHLARHKGDVQDVFAQVIGAMIDGRHRLRIGQHPVLCHEFCMMEIPLSGILLFAPDLEKTRSTERLVAYVPDDPEHPLKEYPSPLAFKQELTRQLRSDSYQGFFARFVPHEKLGVFFSGLGQRLATITWHTPQKGSSLAPWRKEPTDDPKLQFHAAPIPGDPWRHLYQQKLNKILNDARTQAVSTASADSKKRWALWDSFVDIAKSILDKALLVVAPFVPGLGELMMGYMAYQLLDEVFEGIVDWAEGLADQAFSHLMGTVESLVQLGAFALGGSIAANEMRKVLPAEVLAFFDRFKPVSLATRGQRYWQPDLAPYQHSVQPPLLSRPDEQGLHRLREEKILPLEGKHYAVEPSADGHYLIKHPTRADAYRPRLRHNGHGAWHSELEQPLQWPRNTLLRRLGYRVDGLSDADLEQALNISGVSEDALRKLHHNGEPIPPLLEDTLIRLRIDHEIQQLINRLRSDDPAQYHAIDPQDQLHLLASFGYWPKSKALRFLDAHGDVVWECGDLHQPSVQIYENQLKNGDLLKTVLQALSPEEIRTAFGERASDPQLSLEVRTKNLRKALADIAERERPSLFESRYGPTQLSNDPHTRRLMDAAPGLPASVADYLLQQASGAELEQLDLPRTPKRLSDLARAAVEEVRITRAYEGQQLDAVPNIDSERLALNSMKLLPGWSDQMQLVARHDSPQGPIWNTVGADDAALRRTLVRGDDGRYVPYDSSGPLSGATDLYSAILSALPDAQRDALGFGIYQAAELKERLRLQPLQRDELRQVLGIEPTPAAREHLRDLMGSAEGYRAQAPAPDHHLDLHARARLLYPKANAGQITALLNHLHSRPVGADAGIVGLEHEYRQLMTDLHTWLHAIPAEHPVTRLPLTARQQRYQRHNRSHIANHLARCWRRETEIDDYYEEPGRDGQVLRLDYPILGELPRLSANFEHVSLLAISGGEQTLGAHAFLDHFPRLRHLEVKDIPLGTLPTQLSQLNGLNVLSLSNCKITLTPESHASLAGMSQLQTLTLNDNPLGLVPSVEAMPQLVALDLANTSIDSLPAGVMTRPELQSAMLSDNRIRDVPASLFEAPADVSGHFDLSGNPFSRETLERVKTYYQRHGTYWEADAPAVDRQDAQLLYPNLEKDEINRLIYALPGDIEAGKRELARLAGELETLKQELWNWSQTPDLPMLEQARRIVLHVLLEKAWRRDTLQETRQVRTLEINATLAGELPTLSARFDPIGSLVIQGNGGPIEPNAFLKSFPNLDILDIENVELNDIPPAVFELKGLVFLGLPRCSLEMTAASRQALQGMASLEYLDLSHNPTLGELPDFAAMPELGSVLLQNTGLTDVPNGLLTDIPRSAVNLSINAIEQLPASTFDLPAEVLRPFDLGGNPLSRATLEQIKAYCQRTNEYLNARAPDDERARVQQLYPTLIEGEADRYIFRLPGTLDAVTPTLARLEAEYQQMTHHLEQWVLQVPERHPITQAVLDEPTRAQEQLLRDNLKVLMQQAWRRESPEDEESLQDEFTHALTLDTPVMGELPQLNAQLDHVTLFEMTGNGTTTDVDGTLRCFPSLQSLSLNKCALGSVPTSISSMPQLSSLDLSQSMIRLTPSSALEFRNLAQLEFLDLSHNPLGHAPDVTGLHELTSLHLRDTGLRALPQGLFQLRELHTLDLSNNQITEITSDLLESTAVLQEEDCDLSGNPLSAQSLGYLREYFQRTGIDFHVPQARVDEVGVPLSPIEQPSQEE